MSKKHFDEYYNTICKQYFDLKTVMEDISQAVEEGMKTPESLEQLKSTIAPIQDSYRTLNYIKYLLDKPNKNEKVKSYNKRSRRMLLNSVGKQAKDIINDNIKALEDAKLENYK